MGKILELVGCRDILITTESISIPDSVLREIKIEQSMCQHSHGAVASLPLSEGNKSIAQRNTPSRNLDHFQAQCSGLCCAVRTYPIYFNTRVLLPLNSAPYTCINTWIFYVQKYII